MGTTNSGSSCSHEKRYDGCKENWSARMSSGRSNLVEASKRRKKKFVSPMCNCDPYIILFEFGTLQNSRGLFVVLISREVLCFSSCFLKYLVLMGV
ncbi:uncharacterized protein DS421_1g19280 [Arachis hypogaea]|nr:uncharacterized protein DS421_1g19280 [Arachis hypogaea]